MMKPTTKVIFMIVGILTANPTPKNTRAITAITIDNLSSKKCNDVPKMLAFRGDELSFVYSNLLYE